MYEYIEGPQFSHAVANADPRVFTASDLNYPHPFSKSDVLDPPIAVAGAIAVVSGTNFVGALKIAVYGAEDLLAAGKTFSPIQFAPFSINPGKAAIPAVLRIPPNAANIFFIF